MQALHGLGGGRLDGVGHGQQAAHLAVPGDQDRGAAARLRVAAGGVELGRDAQAPLRHQRRAADLDAAAADDALDAEALAVDERLDGLERGRARAPRRRSPARSGARRRPRARRRRPAARPRPTPAAGTTSASAIRPVVTVPVLSSTIVSTRRVDSRISGPLISSPSWAPRPVPTSSAVGVASPSAHGQAMISTATAAVNANARSSPAPIQKPSVATAIPITTGTKTPEIAVGEPLHGRLAGLRLGDQPRDLRERGVVADLRRAHDQPAAGVDARAGHLVAGLLLDGDALAGEQRLVDGRGARLDDPVGGDLLARADDEAVADLRAARSGPALGAVRAEDRDVLGAELQQRGQRGAGAALGARLEVAAGEDEHRDGRGDLEVDLVGAGAAPGSGRSPSSCRARRRRR